MVSIRASACIKNWSAATKIDLKKKKTAFLIIFEPSERDAKNNKQGIYIYTLNCLLSKVDVHIILNSCMVVRNDASPQSSMYQQPIRAQGKYKLFLPHLKIIY